MRWLGWKGQEQRGEIRSAPFPWAPPAAATWGSSRAEPAARPTLATSMSESGNYPTETQPAGLEIHLEKGK